MRHITDKIPAKIRMQRADAECRMKLKEIKERRAVSEFTKSAQIGTRTFEKMAKGKPVSVESITRVKKQLDQIDLS